MFGPQRTTVLFAIVAEPVEKPDARLLALHSHSPPTLVGQCISPDECEKNRCGMGSTTYNVASARRARGRVGARSPLTGASCRPMPFRALNLSPQIVQAVHDAGYPERTPI